MPFIIRGVSLLGVASAGTARDIREAVWQHLASDWKPRHLDRICTREVGLAQLPEVFATMLAGGSLRAYAGRDLTHWSRGLRHAVARRRRLQSPQVPGGNIWRAF